MNKRTINIIISVVISAIVLLVMYYLVRDRLTKLDLAYSTSLLFTSEFSIFLFSMVVLLMPINLFCEALKWKIVSASLSHMSFSRAYTGILAGITAGLFLPNRIGEFAGKSLSLPLSEFWKGSVLAVLTSMAQLMMTLFFGFLAVIYFGPHLNEYFGINLALLPSALSVTGIILLLIVFFNIQSVSVFFRRWKRAHEIVSVLSATGFKMKTTILAISGVRYLVFAVQNLLLLILLNVDVPLLDSFFLIALMYFILSALPTFILTDFPTRSSVMIILFLSWFGISGIAVPYALEAKIILASFLIWLINLILPALPGLYFFNKLSVLRKKDV